MPVPAERHAAARRTVLLVGFSAFLAGCTEESRSSATRGAGSPAPSAPVIQPGRPGEANATLTGSSATATAPAQPAAADIDFMQGMIVHHAQAITIVDIALPGAKTASMVALAKRISAEQKPEIAYMARWLRRFGEAVPPQATNTRQRATGHHASMPGAATQSQLISLDRASGTALEKQFLTLMIRHHEGALTMVRARAKSGTDVDAEAFAGDVAAVQSVQVRQMRSMLSRLG